MFKVDDYVVYNSTGVYKIIDIRTEKDISNNDVDYYVLEPAYNNNIIIKTPVNNPKVLMRKIMTKEAVLSLIATMPEIETIWTYDDKCRSENFKAAIRTGQCEEWVKVIKTLYLAKKGKLDIGKKLIKTDEEIMKAAEKNLHEEIGIALNISPDEVLPYILDHVQ